MITVPLFLAIAVAVVVAILGVLTGSLVTRRRMAGRGAPSSLRRVPHTDTSSIEIGGNRTGQRAAVVMNPTKRDARDLRGTVEAICRQEGWQPPLWLETTADDAGGGQTREALDAGVDVVIAAGGDGTVRCVAEQLAGTDVALGLLPLGTGNLLARNLDVTVDRHEWAVRTALWGRNRRIDVGLAKLGGDASDPAHVFLVLAGIGFDATVMAGTRNDLKQIVGWWAYLEAGMRNLGGPRTKVDLALDDGEPMGRKIRTVLGGNCARLPGGIDLMPDAVIDDGILDVMTVSPPGYFGWMGVAARVLFRTRRGLPVVEHFQGGKVVVNAERELDVQLDGDMIGSTSTLTMQVEPGALLVRVPTPEQRRQMRLEMWPNLALGPRPAPRRAPTSSAG